MLALHIESLTRRYLLHCIDPLEGLFGFGLGTFLRSRGLRQAQTPASWSQAPMPRASPRAWSSCCTSPTRASCFSHSVRSLAALSSALVSACFRVATSVVAPGKYTMILSFCNRVFFYIYISIDRLLLTLVLLELPLSKAELFLGPHRGPPSVRRPPQLVQRTPAVKHAYAY